MLFVPFFTARTKTNRRPNPWAAKTHENRLWQQVNLKAQYGAVQIQHRYRLEQRWVDTLFRQRIGYLAQCIIPLQQTYLEQGKGLFMNVNDEVFLGFGKGIGKNILDQNRFIAAVGYNLDFFYLSRKKT